MRGFRAAEEQALWYQEAGPESDIVISSGVRLSRNLSNFLYSPKLPDEGIVEIARHIDEVFKTKRGLDGFVRYDFETLSEAEATYLEEEGRGIGRTPREHRIVFTSENKTVSVHVNTEDHIRIVSLRGGLNLHEAHREVDEVDTALEELLDFAVSLEWGYLSTNLSNLGSGIGASVLLHLPGIQLSTQFDTILKAVESSGGFIRPYFLADKEETEPAALGDFFLVEGRPDFRQTEKETLEKLEEIAGSLLTYERDMRSLLFEKKKDFLEDQMYRALGILERAKFLEFDESVKLLSLVRLGSAMGCVGHVDGLQVTSLIFQNRPAHVRMRLASEGEAVDEEDVNRERAEHIGRGLRAIDRGRNGV
jgi:protein arginine kinase